VQQKDQFDKARRAFYQTIERSWNKGKGSNKFSQDTLAEVSKISRLLANASLKMVDDIFPFCGLIAAESEINRVWRNIQTACLHPLLILA
jgi:acyl-CoA dehydrogenase-like protein